MSATAIFFIIIGVYLGIGLMIAIFYSLDSYCPAEKFCMIFLFWFAWIVLLGIKGLIEFIKESLNE